MTNDYEEQIYAEWCDKIRHWQTMRDDWHARVSRATRREGVKVWCLNRYRRQTKLLARLVQEPTP